MAPYDVASNICQAPPIPSIKPLKLSQVLLKAASTWPVTARPSEMSAAAAPLLIATMSLGPNMSGSKITAN